MKENDVGVPERWLETKGPWMVTIPRASKLTGIPSCEIRKLCKQEELRYYMAGNRYYVWIEEIKELLSGNKR